MYEKRNGTMGSGRKTKQNEKKLVLEQTKTRIIAQLKQIEWNY